MLTIWRERVIVADSQKLRFGLSGGLPYLSENLWRRQSVR